jgi:hypothetical protein
MSDGYAEFLARKLIIDAPTGIERACRLNKSLYEFQAAITSWGLKRGRAAFFCGTGLGKTPMQCEWARHVADFTEKPVLIVAPLAVSHQTINEAKKILGLTVTFAEDQNFVAARGIYVTNYQKLDKFDPAKFGGIVLDESSILKNQDGSTRNKLIEDWSIVPFRLCCTATPAPNDFMELGNHAEFLGVMTMQEMLATFFVHDGGETQKWRLKGHAEQDFWRWLASWAVCVTHPRDIGFEQPGYDLPELRIHEVIIDTSAIPAEGELFAMPARTLQERRGVRSATISERVSKAVEIAAAFGEDQVCAWCNLNAESEQTSKTLGAVEIAGKHQDDYKSEKMLEFAAGKIQKLVTKPSLAGFGMNWQLCHRVLYIGLSDSWEAFYQSLRRFWRFGQRHPVDAYIIISSMEGEVLRNIKRKEADAQRMLKSLVEHMANFTKRNLKGQSRMKTEYKTDVQSGDNWTAHLGDCVEGARKIESDSVGFSIFSPPFASLYTYSASDRDMGNCRDDESFMEHFAFLVGELLRVTQPGRLCSFHCMNIPTSKVRDGVIGIKDFRGELIRLFESKGWIYHSEVCIWKDPVTAMQRTKAIGLLHKQVCKDSCMSRQGVPDYLVTMRKPGENSHRVEGEFDRWIGDESFRGEGRLSIDVWQRYASPVWMDINPSDTLQFRSAREHADERHVCPLQLQVIERALEMWSNPGDLVLSPFMGIGSEGYVAIENGRKFIGYELKESYYRQSVSNLESSEAKLKETMLL